MSSARAAAPVLVRQAVREHSSGRLAAAADLYRRALAADPTDHHALSLLGALLLQRGEPAAAAPYVAKALLADPGGAYAYNNLGLILKGAGDAAGAARCYLQAIRVRPDFAEAHSNLGVVVKAEGQTALAIAHYRRALDLDPTLGEAANNLGNALQELGEIGPAGEAFLEAAERMPDSDTVHYNVGLALARLGRRQDALVHLRRALELEPLRADAGHMADALDGRSPATAPRTYVRDLFDAYAHRFEAHLVGELRYRAHHELLAAVDAVAGAGRRFALTYDLGCGTGLAGALARARSDLLVGVDLSEKMLRQAERKRIFDALVCGDIDAVLDEHEAAPDLVLACDVFGYLGDIDGTVARLMRRMAAGGLLAFTTERAPDDVRWVLRPSGRFAHGNRYVAGVLADHGLRLSACRPVVLRHEQGRPLEGAVHVAVKPSHDVGTPV